MANLGSRVERFAGRTVLLTGAAGFLGSQFVHFFAALNDSGRIARPCRLMALDNYIRGIPPWLAAASARDDVVVEKVDIIATNSFPSADFIIHAASVASPTFYRKYPIETMDANVTGLRNLLDHSLRHRPQSLLFFSSSEIYGDPSADCIPTAEDYRGFVSCTGPRACYDESKRYGETLCVNFHRVHGIPVKVARPFNNYGPGLALEDRRVLPDFFRDVLAGRNIVLLSDGHATRTFCYISDAITGYLLVLLSDHDGEAFNIGTDRPEISMEELARLVIAISGRELRVVKQVSDDPDYLRDNPQRRCPDLNKARRLLNYLPRVGLDEGLARMFAYYSSAAVPGAEFHG
ncbi:MAG: NAD-dependent epimerase/dehydratase family protein [Planctomycetia bacterium]|nr:NAD-dependent epimerase/dehydratase family protein [Planctomycetia bacterium]